MANRYIDTGFYKSPFVRGLKGSLKSLYSFIICDCTGAGIWNKDLQIASAYIDFNITEKDFEIFIQKGKAVDLGNGKFFFPDFLEHQYPKGLSEKNPAQTNFILELKKYKLIDDNLKTLQRPLNGSMVMVKETVMVPEQVKVIKSEFEKTFDSFLEMRRKIKKPATPRAIELLMIKLNKFPEQLRIPVLEQSIVNGWQDIFELRENKNQQNGKPTTEQSISNRQSIVKNYTDSLRSEEAFGNEPAG